MRQARDQQVVPNILDVDDEAFPEEYQQIIRRLRKAMEDPKKRREMELEDDIIKELQDKERLIEEKDKVLEEKDKVLKENAKVLKEKDKVLKEKDKVLKEKDKAIAALENEIAELKLKYER